MVDTFLLTLVLHITECNVGAYKSMQGLPLSGSPLRISSSIYILVSFP